MYIYVLECCMQFLVRIVEKRREERGRRGREEGEEGRKERREEGRKERGKEGRKERREKGRKERREGSECSYDYTIFRFNLSFPFVTCSFLYLLVISSYPLLHTKNTDSRKHEVTVAFDKVKRNDDR